MKELIQELAGLVYEFNEAQDSKFPRMTVSFYKDGFDLFVCNGELDDNRLDMEHFELVSKLSSKVLTGAIDKVRGML